MFNLIGATPTPSRHDNQHPEDHKSEHDPDPPVEIKPGQSENAEQTSLQLPQSFSYRAQCYKTFYARNRTAPFFTSLMIIMGTN
jgi:hypothetical protein